MTRIFSQSAGFFAAVLCAMFVLAILPETAHAQAYLKATSDAISGTICSIIQILQGDFAKAVAVIALIFLGFSLFLGKVSWGVALAIGIGLAAIFGAGQIVELLSQNQDNLSDDVQADGCDDVFGR